MKALLQLGVALVLSLLLAGAGLAMPRDVEPEDWRAAMATATAEGGAEEGAGIPWKGPWGGGVITYGPILGQGSDRPCRRFSMTYSQVNFNARYSGQICASTAAMARWLLAGEPQETAMQRRSARVETNEAPTQRQTPTPPAQPPASAPAAQDRLPPALARQLAAELVRRLSNLGYVLDATRPLDQAPNRAVLMSFAADHRLSGPLTLDGLLSAAQTSEAASRAAWRNGCSASGSASALACGRAAP